MDALQLVKDFAASIDNAIGSENTETFLVAMTNFAKECPDTMQEIVVLVEQNPKVFDKLLTREGVMEVKGMIENIEAYAPLISAFS
jgi:hypothetical protein